MNERIKELAEQSYKEVIETNDYNGSAYTVREFDKDKFAELIVVQCLEACSRANEIRHFVPPTQEQVVLSCMREIKETFRS